MNSKLPITNQTLHYGIEKSKTQDNSPMKNFNRISNPKQEMIVIHVFDENRNINKDFSCEKDLLTQNMKYFDKYLTDSTSVEDIDISVHCDIKIFEWLMQYLHQKKSFDDSKSEYP